MTVQEIVQSLEQIAPPALSESWDHIGLQLGDPASPVRQILCTLDVTLPVIQLAAKQDCQLIVTHHPLIFSPLTDVRLDQPHGRRIEALLRAGISVYAAHTNWDQAHDGTADTLAKTVCEILQARMDSQNLPPGEPLPYARFFHVPGGQTLTKIAHQLTTAWPDVVLRVHNGFKENQSALRRALVFAGAPDSSWAEWIRQQTPDLVLAGEIRYHTRMELNEAGISTIELGHDVSEQFGVRALAVRLREAFPQLPILLAALVNESGTYLSYRL